MPTWGGVGDELKSGVSLAQRSDAARSIRWHLEGDDTESGVFSRYDWKPLDA